MIAEKKIIKIIQNGTKKEKALLIANHYALKSRDGSGILSEAQITNILDAPGGVRDSKVYGNIRNAEIHIRNFLHYLQTSFVELQKELNSIQDHFYLLTSYLQTEKILNTILQSSDDNGKQSAMEAIEKYRKYDFARIKHNGNDKIKFDMNQKRGLIPRIVDELENYEYKLKCFKTSIDALKKYIRKTGAHIVPYKIEIKDMETWSKKNCSPDIIKLVDGWPKRIRGKVEAVKRWQEIGYDEEHKMIVERVLQ